MSQAFVLKAEFSAGCPVTFYTPGCAVGAVTEERRAACAELKYPETGDGFEPRWWYAGQALDEVFPSPEGWYAAPGPALRPEDETQHAVPLWVRAAVPGEGTCRVTATLCARTGGEVLLFASRRRLLFRGTLAPGQRVTVQALVDVSPIIPRGSTVPAEDSTIDLALVGAAALTSLQVEAAEARRVFVLGDSTVTDQIAQVPYAPFDSYSGWGQMLGYFLPEGLCVSNHAHSGLTTESFRTEGHWAIVEPRLREGDLCLLQFGHNDQKLPHLTAQGGYRERLTEYIAQIRAKGAQPVLVTPLARNSWHPDGTYNDLLAGHAAAVLDVGKEQNVPVLDLHAYAMQWLTATGRDTAKAWFYPSDYTHTNDFGAYKMAAFVAGELCRVLGMAATPRPEWAPQPVVPLTPPAGCPNPNGAADILAPYETERPDEPLTRVEALGLTIAVMKFFPINVYNDLYADVVGHETYAGMVQCAAQNGLIPPALTADGKLYPQKAITRQEFFGVLLPACEARITLRAAPEPPAGVAPAYAYAARLALGEGLAGAHTDWDAPLTRREAAVLCRAIKI